ncbi:MAG: multicopper oxidase domain-containing protein [Gemmatimonadota bacterium]|nr:multicopper oxidase domain-containing protein [Gemmatimonadota bacterium]
MSDISAGRPIAFSDRFRLTREGGPESGVRIMSLTAMLSTVLLGGAQPVVAPRTTDGDIRPLVHPNDNRIPAGHRHGDTLDIHLEVRMAIWRPEADSGPSIEVAAFAEAGKAPEVPGPLIRVPTGTVIVASVQNLLTDSTIAVHGLLTRPAATDDSVVLRPGESATVTFAAGAPGTYLYMAVLGKHSLKFGGDQERETLSGAFVVDPVGGSPPDRIMVMNIWGDLLDSVTYRHTLTINGRSWPYTERIEATTGDSVRWRVINGTVRPHPMHLHGFYFRIDGLGDGLTDTALAPDKRPMAVTQTLHSFTTMAMTWVPDRPGNWLFHCHIGFHVIPDARLDPPPMESHDRMAHDPTVHMAGLVLGIVVHPAPGSAEPVRGKARRLHLFVQEGKQRNRAPRALRYVLQRGARTPAADSIEAASTLLVLTRDEPTDIVVVNRLHEPAAIHWHGIELESYSDGVAGWSGSGNHLAPSIQPGDSFVAHLTLPRAGTFIYHTHMNDIEQLTSGLYGGIVVLEPGRRFDPRRDHVFVAGWDSDAEPVHLLVNGDSLPPPIELAAGVAHRLRFVNIGVAGRFRFSIYRDSSLVQWRRLARDGADLPPALAQLVSSVERVDVGETRDVEFVPPPGRYRLVIGDPAEPSWSQLLQAQ